MARYSDYISNEEYDEALRRYYNGFDNFTDHIVYKKSVAQIIINTNTIEDYLEEGEEYTILNGGYVITSYGRVFNLRFKRFLKPKFYNSDVYIYCGGGSYRMEPTFKKMEWEFDKRIIFERYLEMDWNMKIMDNCKYCGFKETDYLLTNDI
jgi:hypothetical protein